MTTTATTAKKAKLTAANCVAIANVKRAMNRIVAAGFARVMNADGEAAAREYVGTFFTTAARPAAVAGLFGDAPARTHADFAAYIAATWMTVGRDAAGWYVTNDAAWIAVRMMVEGWTIAFTGNTAVEADDTIKTYFTVAGVS